MTTHSDAEQEAQRLKALAETKYKNSNLQSALKHAKKAHRLCPNLEGISSMLTAFKILRAASKPKHAPDWYKILQVEPFSHFNSIKKQYRKLALILHPDKNPFLGCEEAFKLVGEGLLHKFEKMYLGHNLVCPSCKKSFLAVEVDGEDDGHGESTGEEDVLASKPGERLKRKMDGPKGVGLEGGKGTGETTRSVGSRRQASGGKVGDDEMEESSKSKRVKVAEETMTLAEMQLEMKQKANQGREKLNKKEKVKDAGEKEKESERDEPKQSSLSKNEKPKASEKSKDFEIENQGPSQASVNLGIMTRSTKKRSVDFEAKTQENGKKNQNSELTKQGTSRKRVNSDIEKRRSSKSRDMEIVAVEDLDFYDFYKDRSERNFKKGQVWAIYDDDGMPRRYGLIEEVFSVNPFEVKMSWLDSQNNGDDKFKVARKSSINSVNVFSHMVECERAAKEFYRIYPRKGSVWVLYNEAKLGAAGRNRSARDKHCYDIVVLLTTYSETHGLSMAYLEKVDGFKTVFKRQEIGCQAIRWLEKEDIRLFSHQIPARKLSGDDVPDLLKDCWELDPASLPPDLAIGCER
ncbi:hypothetical protein GOBAR_DD19316 [Gossypium barbadense]|nr:hypothetical protein GOBAR_DD19316 [Gossypium barbadense]